MRDAALAEEELLVRPGETAGVDDERADPLGSRRDDHHPLDVLWRRHRGADPQRDRGGDREEQPDTDVARPVGP
jgi:hypothetical protein